MTQPLETARQGVQEKAAHELRDREREQTLLITVPIVFPWQKDWVVHSEPVGSGAAAFKYLASYIFRVALSNRRLVQLTATQVTFTYKEAASDKLHQQPVCPNRSCAAQLISSAPFGEEKALRSSTTAAGL